MDNSISETILQLKLASKAWWKAADDFQSCGMFDDMKRCRINAARLSEMAAVAQEQKANYWRASISPSSSSNA